MAMKLNPYISFKDNAREAMEFYKSVFGGKLDVNTFKEYNAPVAPGEEDLVMHAMLVSDKDLTLMAADSPAHVGEYKEGNNFSVSLSGDSVDDADLSGYFAKLSEGGKVTQPLVAAQWGDKFGMCVDKFGITWLVNIAAPVQA